jgi:hypothetical protein
MFNSNKVGRFEVDAETINDSPDVVQAVLATCIVIDVHHQWHSKAILYTAISEQFEEAPEGVAEPPMYDINVGEDGAITWVKREA